MIAIVLLLAVGVALSALFSGSETGFYRVNRMRLVLDGLDGDLVSRSLLTLTNHPSMFVATVLVGNNLANYVTSLAVVMGTLEVFGNASSWPTIVMPVIFAPLLFIYGELTPKHLFYLAPNRLLRRCGPLLLMFAWLFAPVTGILWALSKLLELFAGETPEQVQLGLARKELRQVFDEGHEAGLLGPAQQGLAQGLFAVASQPVRSFVVPAGRVARVRATAHKDDIRRLAKRHRLTVVPVESDTRERLPVGYIKVVDLYLRPEDEPAAVYPLVEIAADEPYIDALMKLEASDNHLGHVQDPDGKTIGFVTARQLSEPLFRLGI